MHQNDIGTGDIVFSEMENKNTELDWVKINEAKTGILKNHDRSRKRLTKSKVTGEMRKRSRKDKRKARRKSRKTA